MKQPINTLGFAGGPGKKAESNVKLDGLRLRRVKY
jgi:hypothetical protein